MKTIKNKGKGFTLVEVLVVIVIIAILAAIAIPALTNYMDKAKNKVLLANTSDLARYIQAEILYENFDDEHIFTFKGSSNDRFSFKIFRGKLGGVKSGRR
jgi:prepilin-type N-terminal cleavage/methylation domain-containing protein